MMYALLGGGIEINVRAIVMAEKLPELGMWRLFMLDDKVLEVTVAEFNAIRPLVAESYGATLGPMHGTIQILPGA